MIDREAIRNSKEIKKFNINLIKGICPNDCVWCFVPSIKNKKYMPVETMKKFLELNKNETLYFDSMGFGEPLWHPYFSEMMDLITSYDNVKLGMFATTLNTKYIKNIDKIKYFNDVIIEFGGVTEETKYKNMGFHKKEFERNLHYFIDTHPENKICFKMLINKNNYFEQEEFIEYANSFGVDNAIVIKDCVDIHSDEYLDEFIKDSLTKKAKEKFSYKYFYDNNSDENFKCEKPEHIKKLEKLEYKHANIFHYLFDCDGYGYMCHIAFGISDDEKRHQYSIGRLSEIPIVEIEKNIENLDVYKKMKETRLFDFCKQCHVF